MANSTTNKTYTINITQSEWPRLSEWLTAHDNYRRYVNIRVLDIPDEELWFQNESDYYLRQVYCIEFSDRRVYTHYVLTCV